jgi:hypothetical protein
MAFFVSWTIFLGLLKKMAAHLIDSGKPGSVNRPEISFSEAICLEIPDHNSGYKCFQYYYRTEVEKGYLKSYFPAAPC